MSRTYEPVFVDSRFRGNDKPVRQSIQEQAHDRMRALVDYDGLIPNNVGLNADPRLRRALESWHPGCIDWWKERGPEGFQANLVYLRTAVSVEPEGWAKFGYVKMPEYRWGILLAPAIEGRTHRLRRAPGRAGLAGSAGRIPRDAAPADRRAGRHRAGFGRAAAPSRPHRPVALRSAQPVPGQCRGGPPFVGDGLPACRNISGATGARRPRICCAGSSGDRDSPRLLGRLQRGDAGLARLFHVHLLHRPRRQDAVACAGAIGVRPAVAHLPLHAHRRGTSHVRRPERGRAHHRAHLRRDARGRDRRPDRHRAGARARASSTCRRSRSASTCISR